MPSCTDNLTLGELKELRAFFVPTSSTSKSVNGEYCIVVLQRGWVAIGDYYQDGSDCRLENAKVIRVWGTKKGIGEIALNGPTKDTVLDDTGTMKFHEFSVVSRIETDKKKWK